jgi:hypothetical protein
MQHALQDIYKSEVVIVRKGPSGNIPPFQPTLISQPNRPIMVIFADLFQGQKFRR